MVKIKKLNPKARDSIDLKALTDDEILKPESRIMKRVNKNKSRALDLSSKKVDLTPVKKGKLARRVNPFFPLIWLLKYVRDSYRELKNVTWPNRNSTLRMLVTVFIFAAILSTFLFGIDFGLNQVFKKLFERI
jgi:preprotein translocase SecE subunit